eukprot:g16068.t1
MSLIRADPRTPHPYRFSGRRELFSKVFSQLAWCVGEAYASLARSVEQQELAVDIDQSGGTYRLASDARQHSVGHDNELQARIMQQREADKPISVLACTRLTSMCDMIYTHEVLGIERLHGVSNMVHFLRGLQRTTWKVFRSLVMLLDRSVETMVDASMVVTRPDNYKSLQDFNKFLTIVQYCAAYGAHASHSDELCSVFRKILQRFSKPDAIDMITVEHRIQLLWCGAMVCAMRATVEPNSSGQKLFAEGLLPEFGQDVLAQALRADIVHGYVVGVEPYLDSAREGKEVLLAHRCATQLCPFCSGRNFRGLEYTYTTCDSSNSKATYTASICSCS